MPYSREGMPPPEWAFGGPEKQEPPKAEAAPSAKPSAVPEKAERSPDPPPPKSERPEFSAGGDRPTVPESEIDIDFVRSSGPGGQKVNKTSSKAQLRWSVGRSAVFSERQKELIRRAAGNRLNAADEIVLSEQTERSQPQNRDAVVARLQRLVAEALTPRKERKPTKPSWGEKQRRMDDKRRQGDKKQGRREPKGGW